MQFDARLLAPTFRRTWDLVAAMPFTFAVAMVLAAMLGVLSDVASEQSSGINGVALFAYSIALTFVQVWISREAFEKLGARPVMSIANAPSLFIQNLLIGIAMLVGLLLLVLPGIYIVARWYLANAFLILHGGGRRAAMGRSWALMESRWPVALGIMIILTAVAAVPLLTAVYPLPFAADYKFGMLIATNLVSAVGIVASYLAAIALLTLIEPPTNALQEIFS